MLPFIRADLAQLQAYTPHPEASIGTADPAPIDLLDTNENPYDLPADLQEKLAWTFQHSIASNRYPDGGMAPLKAAIAAYVNESAALSTFGNSHITLGNGSDELIRSILIATCLSGSGSILVAHPTFSMYGILAQTLGVPVVTVGRTDTFAMDLEAATRAIADTQAPPIRVVFVVHPNSPTANALTPAEITWLQGLPPEILVVVDEAYFEFSQTTLVEEVAQRPNWMVLRTFSKAFRLAAHRVGYAIAHPDVITALEKVRLPYNLPSFTQAAALTALAHRQALLAVIPEILGERSRLYASLTQHPALQVWSSSANFLYLRLHPPTPDADAKLAALCHTLKARGTRIRHTGGGLRITIGTPAENTRTLHRLQAILAAPGAPLTPG